MKDKTAHALLEHNTFAALSLWLLVVYGLTSAIHFETAGRAVNPS